MSDCSTTDDPTTGSTTDETGCGTECPATTEVTGESESDPSCGPNPCGACQDGCTPNDVCEMGEWSCECVCDSGSDTDATTGGEGDVMCVPENGGEPSFPSFDKSCNTVDDCALVFHQVDCCGNAEAWGINLSELPAFDEAEAICQSQYPGCGCPNGPPLAEDGNSAWNDAIDVKCEGGQCMSFVP